MKIAYKFFSILSLVLFSFAQFSCSNDGLYQDDFDLSQLPGTTIYNFSTKQLDGKDLKWDLQSDEAKFFDDKNAMYLSTVKINFYSKEGQVSSWLIADEATVNTATPDKAEITLISNVLMQSSNQTTLEGHRFIYHEDTEKLTSEEKVKVTYPDGTEVTGVGFEANNRIEQIVFKSQVEGQVSEE
jgi:LPS export ABC transporter protein LptC